MFLYIYSNSFNLKNIKIFDSKRSRISFICFVLIKYAFVLDNWETVNTVNVENVRKLNEN